MGWSRFFPSVMVALCAAVAIPPARAQSAARVADSLRYAAIRQLLAVQRTDSLMLAGVEQAFAQQQPDPNMPAGYMDSVRARIRRDIGQFVERLVPVYDSLYTMDEIGQLTSFYRSPVGQRLLNTQVQLMEATAQVGRQWGMEVAGQVLVELARQRPTRP